MVGGAPFGFGIVADASALLLAVERQHGRIQVELQRGEGLR